MQADTAFLNELLQELEVPVLRIDPQRVSDNSTKEHVLSFLLYSVVTHCKYRGYATESTPANVQDSTYQCSFNMLLLLMLHQIRVVIPTNWDVCEDASQLRSK